MAVCPGASSDADGIWYACAAVVCQLSQGWALGWAPWELARILAPGNAIDLTEQVAGCLPVLTPSALRGFAGWLRGAAATTWEKEKVFSPFGEVFSSSV